MTFTVNWTNPKRSSAKIAGLRFRGNAPPMTAPALRSLPRRPTGSSPAAGPASPTADQFAPRGSARQGQATAGGHGQRPAGPDSPRAAAPGDTRDPGSPHENSSPA